MVVHLGCLLPAIVEVPLIPVQTLPAIRTRAEVEVIRLVVEVERAQGVRRMDAALDAPDMLEAGRRPCRGIAIVAQVQPTGDGTLADPGNVTGRDLYVVVSEYRPIG